MIYCYELELLASGIDSFLGETAGSARVGGTGSRESAYRGGNSTTSVPSGV